MIRLKPDNDICVRKAKAKKVPLLILSPREAPEHGTGILWIHGGGYITGMKEMVYMSRAADLVKKFGVTVFSPGYRLAWQKPYPAAVNDCFRVLEHIDRERPALGADRIMVGGVPKPINLRMARVTEHDGDKLVAGVSILDGG